MARKKKSIPKTKTNRERARAFVVEKGMDIYEALAQHGLAEIARLGALNKIYEIAGFDEVEGARSYPVKLTIIEARDGKVLPINPPKIEPKEAVS